MTRYTDTARVLRSIALLACVTVVGQPAAAQDSSTGSGIETVVVTAEKRAEDIQAVPQSVTAVDAATIVNSHLTTLEDLSSVATNLNIVNRADNTPDVTLRGVGSFGVIQGVGFYANDVQQFEGQTVRPMDIESIEILKGPQGTLYGGANIGGAIKYATKLPTEDLTAEATAEYGDQSAVTLEGAISGPIIANQLLGRLSLFSSSDKGFLFDPFLNRILGHSDEKGGRLTLEYLDGPTTIRFYFSGDRLRNESENLYNTPPDDHTYSESVPFGLNALCPTPSPYHRAVCDGFVPSYFRELYSPTLQIDREFGGVTLTSVSSYFHSFIKSVGDLDKTPLPLASYVQDFNKSVWSEELRLASSDSSAAFKWLVGAFAQGIDSYTLQLQNNADPGQPVTGVQPDAYGHNQTSAAVFGNATYAIERWSFEGGLGIWYYRNRMNDTTAALPASLTAGGIFPVGGGVTTGCAPCSGAVERVEVLPRASASYHFSDADMAYFTIARGFEPADLTDEPITNPPPFDFTVTDVVHAFKPEYALSYELGWKSTLFDNRLRLNGALFYIDYSNRLFEVGKFVGSAINTFEQNVGESHNYGLELNAEYVPLDDLTLSAGLGLTRAIFGSALVLDNAGICPIDNNPQDATFGQSACNLKGLSGPNTPDYQVTLAADWHQPLMDSLMLGARISARLLGRSWWDGFNRFEQRPYQVVDAGLRLEFEDHWTLAAQVKNLFNEKYNTFYADGSETGAPFNVAGVSAPRQAFISLTARY